MPASPEPDDRIPLFAIGAILIRSRWRIARWAVIGGVLALAPVINKKLTYRASASFIPEGHDAAQSGLAGLAGQFGINVGQPSGGSASSPDFYVKLMKSRVLLQPIVHDTFSVAELDAKPRPLIDVLEIPAGSSEAREERAIEALAGMISTSVGKTTGVVEINVVSQQRSLALHIAERLLGGLNDYNQKVRLSNAGQERRHIETRLDIANRELRVAEGRLDDFNSRNRVISGSPELQTQRERLQRDVSLKQTLYTSLATSYEDVRMREARDAPVISIFEPPAVPTKPQPRGRFGRLMFGLMLGTMVGLIVTIVSTFMAHRQDVGDADAADFVRALRGLRDDLLRPFRWARRSAKS